MRGCCSHFFTSLSRSTQITLGNLAVISKITKSVLKEFAQCYPNPKSNGFFHFPLLNLALLTTHILFPIL